MAIRNIYDYDDIINLAHHISAERKHMPVMDRAAQFSPFAALTGYNSELRESVRLTESKAEADEDRQYKINTCLQYLIKHSAEHPKISIIYFIPDEKKQGGAYITDHGNFRWFDEYNRNIVLTNGKVFFLDDIYDLAVVRCK